MIGTRTVLLIVTALVVATTHASAQQNRTVRGLVDQCYAVNFIDQALPFDSVVTDRPIPDSAAKATLLAMQCRLTSELSDTVSVPIDTGIGRLIDITLVRLSDSLYVVQSASDDEIDAALVYQLVIPLVADTIVIDSAVTARPWNGSSGGVLSFLARDVLIVSDTIKVAGLGYRGGDRSANGGECNATEACAPLTSVFSAGKGESVYRPSADCTAGYAPLVTGGGGGNSHNSGGGGGANGGAGGRGGDQWQCGGVPGMYGLPGRPGLVSATDRLFFGGGGGGGHQNNNVGTSGGSGGGIILLKAPFLLADEAVLTATGSDVTGRAGNDGAGGGGAGGTVLLDACRLIGTLDIDARGGRGGNCDDSHGPGGGGGGGMVLLHPGIMQFASAQCRIDAAGGGAGIVHSGSTSRGGMKGTAGKIAAYCGVVPLHTIDLDSAGSIGDTLRVRLSARDTGSTCDVVVEHEIMIIGGAVSPILGGTFADYVVSDQRIRWNERLLTLQLLSRQSIDIPLLGVASRDTTALISVRSAIPGIGTNCIAGQTSQRVRVDACARALRPITRGLPFALTITNVDATHVSCRVQAYASAEVQIRAVNLHGEVIAERVMSHLPMLGPGEFIAEAKIDMSSAAHGTYLLTAASVLGSRAVPFMWTP